MIGPHIEAATLDRLLAGAGAPLDAHDPGAGRRSTPTSSTRSTATSTRARAAGTASSCAAETRARPRRC
jgi:hypothetical protein